MRNVRLQAHKDNSRLVLNDNQSQELSELVNEISSSEAGKSELENIFIEADKYGEGTGHVM